MRIMIYAIVYIPLTKETFGCLASMDGKAELHMQSFESSKIRLLRSLSVEGSDGVQVLDFDIFPRAEFSLPIFCANFFTTAVMNIVVLFCRRYLMGINIVKSANKNNASHVLYEA